ncbi:MAG: hypothetical protein PHR77_15930 [Kiritimatiellae bacterium]|nr:hypothetical protein [Kiritimatiellia bacterium]MDD5520650.1 hypothetical protein [Kiritimatiellia bacterium]
MNQSIHRVGALITAIQVGWAISICGGGTDFVRLKDSGEQPRLYRGHVPTYDIMVCIGFNLEFEISGMKGSELFAEFGMIDSKRTQGRKNKVTACSSDAVEADYQSRGIVLLHSLYS